MLIIDILHKCQEQNFYLQKFSCDKFDAMPPSSGYEPIGNTLNILIEQITSLREELKTIEKMPKEKRILLMTVQL